MEFRKLLLSVSGVRPHQQRSRYQRWELIDPHELRLKIASEADAGLTIHVKFGLTTFKLRY
jgi:hypothetical protein